MMGGHDFCPLLVWRAFMVAVLHIDSNGRIVTETCQASTHFVFADYRCNNMIKLTKKNCRQTNELDITDADFRAAPWFTLV